MFLMPQNVAEAENVLRTNQMFLKLTKYPNGQVKKDLLNYDSKFLLTLFFEDSCPTSPCLSYLSDTKTRM